MNIKETHYGYQLQCPDCTFKVDSLIPNRPTVHVCSDHTVKRHEFAEIKGQKTSPQKAPVVANKRR